VPVAAIGGEGGGTVGAINDNVEGRGRCPAGGQPGADAAQKNRRRPHPRSRVTVNVDVAAADA
jgi:hypothetical protein